MLSHPVRVRGLKAHHHHHRPILIRVAPRAGAWIESGTGAEEDREAVLVAPRAGAWIESERVPDGDPKD